MARHFPANKGSFARIVIRKWVVEREGGMARRYPLGTKRIPSVSAISAASGEELFARVGMQLKKTLAAGRCFNLWLTAPFNSREEPLSSLPRRTVCPAVLGLQRRNVSNYNIRRLPYTV